MERPILSYIYMGLALILFEPLLAEEAAPPSPTTAPSPAAATPSTLSQPVATETESPPPPEATRNKEDEKPQRANVPLKSLDGVSVEAVEAYPGIKKNEFNLGIGFYPFNAYYHGLSLTSAYQLHFGNTWSWEVFNGSYFFTFDKALTTQLADRYHVTPESIDRIQFLISSNGVFSVAKGKFVFLKNFIRYFDFSVVHGYGLVTTKHHKRFVSTLGGQIKGIVGDHWSWAIDVRDSISIPALSNYVVFTMLGGFSF